MGTVNDMPAKDWKSYRTTADHPEYPSASTCFCSSLAQSMRRFFGSDKLNFTVPVPAGSSTVEPGMPEKDLLLMIPTWTDFEEKCAQSRVDGGVHFPAAISEATRKECHKVGDEAWKYYQRLVKGKEPLRKPEQPLPMSILEGPPPGVDHGYGGKTVKMRRAAM